MKIFPASWGRWAKLGFGFGFLVPAVMGYLSEYCQMVSDFLEHWVLGYGLELLQDS